nr:hypothetical protein [Fredinandcohnia onubensis]
MSKEPLYQEWGYKLIPSSYGELRGQKRCYRVFYGTVNWHTADPGNTHKACVPFVQYGQEKDFNTARKRGDIRELYPCHILDEDLEEVIAAMKELKEREY